MLDSEKSWLAGALEAMLFVTDEPVTVLTFADMLEAEPAIIQETLEELDVYKRQAQCSYSVRYAVLWFHHHVRNVWCSAVHQAIWYYEPWS